MLLRFGLGLEREAQAVERAVDAALASGLRTGDLLARNAALDPGAKKVGTVEMGDAIIAAIKDASV